MKEGLFHSDGKFISREEIMNKTVEVFNAETMGKPVDLREALLDVLDYKSATPLSELGTKLGLGIDIVTNVIDEMIASGHGIARTESGFLKTKNVNPEIQPSDETYLGNNFKFGLVSDTHGAAKGERLDALNKMYDIFQSEGISTVFHAGDISEGWGVYRGQEFEVKFPGQGEQIDYVVANYPYREGIITKFITGNHDLKMYEKGGIDPGRPIAKARTDMKYLGPMAATVKMVEGVTMELLHPAGNTAYALSYKAQRDINNRPPDSLPNILVYGHYHTSYYMNYRNINFLQVPCFKDQGLWEKRLGLNPTIGGWIVEGAINSGKIVKFKPELHTFGGGPR